MARLNTAYGLKEQAGKNAVSVPERGDQLENFSLRDFYISCVLMSYSTVEEKLSLLFDTFAKISGISAENSPAMIFEMISSIFNRNMYFWPAHELYN